MSKKSVAKNYIYNMIYQVLIMIIPLITTPYLSRVLGAENIGIYSYTLSIITYFILFGSLGIATYGQREIAYVQNDIHKRSKIFYEIIIIRFIALFLSLILFYMFFCIKGQYLIYYRILILELLANVIDISWYFQGLEDFKKTVMRNIFVKLVSVALIFTLVKSSSDLKIYVLIYVLSTFIGNLSLWLYLPKNIVKQKFKDLSLKKHLKPTIALFIPQVAVQVYTVLDKTMIGTIILDKREVGYYEQAQKIVKLLMALATSLGTVMMPRIANIYASGDKVKLKKYMMNSFSFIMMLAFPLMFGIVSISNSFVPIFFGEKFLKVSVLINVISPIIVIIGLSNVIGVQYLLPTKQQNKYTISVLVGALVNFLLNLYLIKKYASVGASIATVIAEISVTATQFILVRKEISIKEVMMISYKYVISSIVMFGVSMLLGYFINNNLLSIIIQIILSSITYFTLLIILKDKFIFEGINKIKEKLLKRKA